MVVSQRPACALWCIPPVSCILYPGEVALDFGTIKDVVLTAFREFNEDKVPRLAAAQAYYTAFALAPLLLIAVAIAGMILGEDAARGELSAQLESVLGQTGAEAVEQLLTVSRESGAGPLAAILGFVALAFGAGGFFAQLQDSLNTIWDVAPDPDLGFWNLVRARGLSFLMVLGTGFLLLASFLITTFLSGASSFFSERGIDFPFFWTALNFAVSVTLTMLIFALVFKVLPDVQIMWRDVWFGAFVTTALFLLGRWAISEYLARSAVRSAFGAAGSLVIILIWVNFSAMIVFFGAEITQVYARRFGTRIRPSRYAIDLSPQGRANQGIPKREFLEERRQEREA
ncbi:MAG: YihY/virulence factor BrkB family protein [Oscillochloris sp.]|nr:YihY/virulence factor BrkB family protein [Oscillochloris sp.]